MKAVIYNMRAWLFKSGTEKSPPWNNNKSTNYMMLTTNVTKRRHFHWVYDVSPALSLSHSLTHTDFLASSEERLQYVKAFWKPTTVFQKLLHYSSSHCFDLSCADGWVPWGYLFRLLANPTPQFGMLLSACLKVYISRPPASGFEAAGQAVR